MIQCPHPNCPKKCETEKELVIHMWKTHQTTPAESGMTQNQGYYEPHTEEIPALEHQAAAIKANLQKQNILAKPMRIAAPISVPVVPVSSKKIIQLPDGWIKQGDSYVFEQVLSEEHTVDDIILIKAVGKVTFGYGNLEMYTYTKSTSELAELVERENILTNKLSGLVPSDGAYLEIIKNINPLHSKIKQLKRDMRPEINIETILQDSCKSQSRDQILEFQESFMRRSLEEFSRVRGIVQKKDPIPIEKHKAED